MRSISRRPEDGTGIADHTAWLRATDGDFGRDVQTIKVKVTDVNEAPTITSGGAGELASYIVVESAFHHGNVITTIQATDPDKSDAPTYSIVLTFLIMAAVLAFRPQGLLGTRR